MTDLNNDSNVAIVTLKLKRILTYSMLDKTTNEYSQAPFPDKIIVGNIEKDVLNMIIDMNLYIVKDLLNLTEKHRGVEWNEATLRILFKKLAIMTRACDIKVVDRAITDWFDQIIPVILQTLTEASIDEAFQTYQLYGDMQRIRTIEGIVKASLDSGDYDMLVNTLIDLNRVIFPNYAIGMLLCVLSELYIVFLDIKSSTNEMEKDDIVVHILSSYLQKLMYESDAYTINLKQYCDENSITIRGNCQDIERVVYNHVKSQQCVRSMFPFLNIKNYTISSDKACDVYNLWTCADSSRRYAIYKSLGIHTDFDLLPYILTSTLGKRFDRLRIHIKILLSSKIVGLNADIKSAILPYYAQYDQIFDHIMFPNAGLGTRDVGNQTINANRFEVGDFSMRSLLKSFISSGLVNKFTSAISVTS